MKRTTIYILSLITALMLIFGMGAAGDSNFTNLVTTGNITTVGNVTIGSLLVTAMKNTLTVTNATGFTPAGAFQPLTAAGSVTPTVNILPAGTVVVLVNAGTNAITIADTSIQKLTADAVLGQYDSLTIISDGTNWIELARANN